MLKFMFFTFHLPLGLPNVLFCTSFPTNTVCVVSLCMCHMLWPWQSPRFDNLIRSGEDYKTCSSSLYSFLYCPITSPLLRLKYIPEGRILEHLSLYKKRKKVKLTVCAWRHLEGVEVYLYFFLSSALDGGEWSAWWLSLFSPGKEFLVSTEQEAGSA